MAGIHIGVDTPETLKQQFSMIRPYYERAYRLAYNIPETLEADALKRWDTKPEKTMLSAVVSVIEVLDEYRLSHDGKNGKNAA